MTALIGTSPSAVVTSAEYTGSESGKAFGLGDRYTDHAGNTYVYVQASASLTQYDAVRIKASYQAAQLTIDTGKQAVEVGFAQAAFQIGDRGWVQITGRPLIRLAADCDKELQLYATSTGGVLDDATTSVMIQGVICTTSVTGATTAATCVASFPTLERAIGAGGG
jgi:hypothetical protein